MLKYLLFSFVLLSSTTFFAQTVDLGGPISWRWKYDFKKIVPQQKMSGFDLAAIQAEDAINDEAKDRPWRFGYKYQTDFSLENSGVWVTFPNGSRLWRLEIIASGAMTMNLLLDNVHIPEGAYLYLSDKAQTNRVGAYTSRNNHPSKELGTELIHGDHMVVEYFEPKEVKDQGSFTITDVVHGYRSLNIVQDQLSKALNSSGGCNIDVNCPRNQPEWYNLSWQDQIRSVAMIVVNGSGVCTGALINNTCGNGTPYFLTANHCLRGNINRPNNWAFRFNWNSPVSNLGCANGTGQSANPGPPYDQTAYGATLLVHGTEADHCLVQIDNMTLSDAQSWNAYYAGWNRNDTESGVTNAVGIHHPRGDVKKICRAEGSNISHNTRGNPAASVWFISSWTEGVTESGSSGSPLFDQNGRIIGQLYGGGAACNGNVNNGQPDYYGRLGVSWPLGISSYLAPSSCGTAPLVLDGLNANSSNINDDAGIAAINSPNENYCGSLSFTPKVVLQNFGQNNLTSVVITYNIDGGINQTFNWTGSLSTNETEEITLPNLTSTTGNHTFNASTSQPNGTTDVISNNDGTSQNFSLVDNGKAITLLLKTDCWAYETYWELKNGQGSVVESGGNTSGIPPGGNRQSGVNDPGAYSSGITITKNWCLTDGCYEFTVYDDWGDGIDGGTGCDSVGGFTITGEANQVLVNGNPDFQNSTTENFCTSPVGISELKLSDFKIFPNPNKGEFSIETLKPIDEISRISVTDLTGRTVFESSNITQKMNINISRAASGTYLLRIIGKDSKMISKIMKQ